MIEEPKRLTIKRDWPRPSAEQIAAFQGVPTGFVVDAMFGGGSLATQIAPLTPDQRAVAGPAVTADNRPSDVLPLLAALNFVRPGDVLVTAVDGYQGCAAAGDRVAGMARNGGAVGLVSDGPMRDFAGILETGLPCWCTGLNPGSPFATGPGKVGTPMLIGGQRVASGDMIVADRDGVVVVPLDQIDGVIARLPEVAKQEEALDGEVAKGLTKMDSIAALLASDDINWID